MFLVGLIMIIAGGVLLGIAFVVTPPLPVTIIAFLLVSGGAATVSPPSTTLALVDYPQYAGTASSVLGLFRFAAGGVVAPLVGLAGSSTMQPLALVVLVASVAAMVTYFWLVKPADIGAPEMDRSTASITR